LLQNAFRPLSIANIEMHFEYHNDVCNRTTISFILHLLKISGFLIIRPYLNRCID